MVSLRKPLKFVRNGGVGAMVSTECTALHKQKNQSSKQHDAALEGA